MVLIATIVNFWKYGVISYVLTKLLLVDTNLSRKSLLLYNISKTFSNQIDLYN